MSRRLLQAIAGARHGGAETFFVRLAAALQHAGETQRVLIRRDAARAQSLRAAGVAVAEHRFGGPLDLATRLAFRREIARWRPDIVLTWMSRATRLCPRGDFMHVARLGGYYDLKFYRRCDRLIGNTSAIVDYAVAAGWPRDRIEHLPNFVPDAGAVPVRPRPAGEHPSGEHPSGEHPSGEHPSGEHPSGEHPSGEHPSGEHPSGEHPSGEHPSGEHPYGLALGRLHPNKGFGLLLEALARTPKVRLAIAGEGPLRPSLETLAARLGLGGRVRFLGWREDVPALLANADFLVCPSLHEPLGNVVIEAWSAGVPVVATASDGPRGLIRDGENGLLVPLPAEPGGGPAALAAAIEALCEDPMLRRRLGQAGRRAYEAGFTEAAVVARYRDFFDRLAR